MNQLQTDQSLQKEIPTTRRTTCEVCEKPLREAVMQLPDLPLTEIFSRKKPSGQVRGIDQALHVCRTCGHGQLERIIDPRVLYTKQTYYFRTQESASGRRANDVFLDFLKRVTKGEKFSRIIDIGCSDGYLLKKLKSMTGERIGIDPILMGKERECEKEGITAIPKRYEEGNLNDIIGKGKSLILTSHTVEHLANPKKMIESVISSEKNDALCIFQFPCLEKLVAFGRYDQIFHQHLQYFSLFSLRFLLDRIGAEIVAYEYNESHWGTLMVAFRKKRTGRKERKKQKEQGEKITTQRVRQGYKAFTGHMKRIRTMLAEASNGKTYGFGASLMLPVLAYHIKTDFSFLTCILDDDEKKNGVYYGNVPVIIRTCREKEEVSGATVLITAPDAQRTILKRVMPLEPKKIIVPINSI